MLDIILYLLAFGAIVVVAKFCLSFFLNLIKWGIILFILVGAVVGVLYLLDCITGGTAWTIAKWAYFIGCGLGVIEFICRPKGFIRDAIDGVNTPFPTSNSSESSSDSSSEGGWNDPWKDGCYTELHCRQCRYWEYKGGGYCNAKYTHVDGSTYMCGYGMT